VLGDDEHRINYAKWLEAMNTAITAETGTFAEKNIALAAQVMLDRLR
jgi:hypothetical protein